jgi:probable rRNA maturation factor
MRPGRARPALSLAIQEPFRDPALPIDRPSLRRWVRAALECEARLVVRFVDADEGRVLNRNYRRRDRPTNVLTFAYALAPRVEADIVICVPVVLAEARAAGIAAHHHLAHLVVHGTLHAQGHEHENDAQALAMERREAAILGRFGIADPFHGR